jgi:hypothetical protein
MAYSKKKRTHADQMFTMAELHGLYKVKIVINKMIKKLEVVYEKDKKKRTKKGETR